MFNADSIQRLKIMQQPNPVQKKEGSIIMQNKLIHETCNLLHLAKQMEDIRENQHTPPPKDLKCILGIIK